MYKNLDEFECQGQKSKIKDQGNRGQETKKCGILYGSAPRRRVNK